jgi:peptidoglycan/xylan/chitin deacetylase (PgdA/CDA1 family)
VAKIEQITGSKPRGWLGSGLQETWNTLDYLAASGIDYVCDWVNDDQPYLMDVGAGRMVSLPYSTEINDLPAFHRFFRSVEDFEAMIRRQFDTLYREGAESGRVMAIALHPFVIGMPHRIWALESGLDYIAGHDDVWFATGREIVDHYLASGSTF